MEKEIEQLVEMGATRAQARAALSKYKDVMQAAERIFDGQFNDVVDEPEKGADVIMGTVPTSSSSNTRRSTRLATPDDDASDEEDGDGDEDEDEDGDDEDQFMDYDSDNDAQFEPTTKTIVDSDPYSGIFFSKDRREEVIEVEEAPETAFIPEANERVKIMTQGQWMKGCPEGGEQAFLFSLYNQLSQGTCACPQKCGYSVTRQKTHFFALFPEFSTYVAQLKKILKKECRSCRATFCFACGEPIDEKQARPKNASDNDILFHCPDIQGVMLGIGLSMLEQKFSDTVSNVDDSSPVERSTKKRKIEVKPTPSPSVDYEDDDDYMPVSSGKKSKGGIGYAGNAREDSSGQSRALDMQRAKDKKFGQLLAEVRVFLPSLHRPGGGRTSDYLVHPTALAHLRRRFNYICSTLLRNDSLTDMSDRSVLYFELFEWLETVSNHEALASMMAMPIMTVTSVSPVSTKNTSSGKAREKLFVYEGSSSPRELLEALVIQAQAAIKGLEGVKAPEPEQTEMTEEEKRMTANSKGKAKETSILADENLKLAKFCNRIISTANAIDRSLRETKGEAFVNKLHASLPKITTGKDSTADDYIVSAGDTEAIVIKTYEDWATKVRFEYCDLTIPSQDNNGEDEVPHYKFYYNNDARALAGSDIPKRSLSIAKELAVLTTNLPVAWNSSVFLRVDDTRVDIIKALITGPEGTPYYNGCFLFDIFLGPSYNSQPPNVKYMTTHGGRFRFNPNLYADGKVCLSLLGTWSGPGWVAGKSTLLQVLVSIQSMILCDEPYLNEPSWANDGGTPQSLAYSKNVRRMVVKAAMLGNLKNPPDPFGDVIRTHFRLKAKSISAQLDKWLAEDDRKPTLPDGGGYGRHENHQSTNDFHRDVEELKRLLGQLETTGAIEAGSSSA